MNNRQAKPEYRPHTLQRYVEGTAPQDTVDFAREQRHAPTSSERKLWECLRDHRLGCKFRRQHPFGDFVFDFFCQAARLAIEIDGAPHAKQRGYDEWRDALLAASGIMTLRIATDQVESNLEAVLSEIKRACLARIAERNEIP